MAFIPGRRELVPRCLRPIEASSVPKCPDRRCRGAGCEQKAPPAASPSPVCTLLPGVAAVVTPSI
ncbi:hypothetical protein AZH53_09630 [Methanomicrobiaceae archaeon CYW5]|uniref:hypothetical protein n=1 Tax=Methanovulcanius yangii TaxID=1789227 RepID=UPI0029CAA263|nr:hypothetical protein [Methanovulcanius yangii]MBT8508664.1 hypothetical protein [Methanovulcanius yangii]